MKLVQQLCRNTQQPLMCNRNDASSDISLIVTKYDVYYSRFFVFKGPYHPFCIFEPNIFNFHRCYVRDNHFQKHTTGTVN
ncbi:hypothetical protein LDENG_00243300 [Lucifuga dentata]|nr:hypothetical protein LDENG_00243300 [Lucifuga dentata]